MKTKNTFTLTDKEVTVTILDVTGMEKGSDLSTAKVLATKVFDVSAIPDVLEDGDKLTSIKAYGLSSIMQDRSSQYTDGQLAESCNTVEEIADMRLATYQATFEQLASGVFRAKRAKAERVPAVDVYFATALVLSSKEKGRAIDVAQATAILQSLTDEQRKALRVTLKDYIVKAKADAAESVKDFDLSDLI